MEYIIVGNIVTTFGIKGELKIKSYTDFPKKRFKVNQQLYIYYENKYAPFRVATSREYKGFWLISFKDNENINFVEKYKNCDLYIDKQELHSLPAGKYYFFQLKNCDVFYNNQKIGVVLEVEEGYQNLLRIKTAQNEFLLPYVDRFIKNVNIDENRIDIDVIEGML